MIFRRITSGEALDDSQELKQNGEQRQYIHITCWVTVMPEGKNVRFLDMIHATKLLVRRLLYSTLCTFNIPWH